MKEKLVIVLLLIFGSSSICMAEGGDQYFLPKIGFMSIDLNNADNLLSVGFLYGYGLNNDISLETEINAGFKGGESDNGNYRVWTAATYSVYRYPLTKTSYLKAKFGLLFENVSLEKEFTNNTLIDEDFGLAGGLGAGLFFLDAFTLEAEVTAIDRHIMFYSFGAHYRF